MRSLPLENSRLFSDRVMSLDALQRYFDQIIKLPHVGPSERWLMMMMALHVPLSIAMKLNPALGKMHCAATFLLGLHWALAGNSGRAAQVCAYIAGAEVLWRMTNSSLVYEFGKYGTCVILLVTMIRREMRFQLLPRAYFALLMISIPVTLSAISLARARQVLSADLSGPFAIMISACFFSQLTLRKEHYHRWFLITLAPLSGIITLSWHSMLTAASLTFHGDSNFVASGGFGPNQVSAILGLGAVLAFFAAQGTQSRAAKLIFILAIAVFLAQSMLTFSRTGLYLAVVSMFVASSYLLRHRGHRLAILSAGGVAFVLIWSFLLPRLDAFTEGNLSARLRDTNMSGREHLFWQEVELWLKHPILGVGPGMSGASHVGDLAGTRSHTEFSRLLAEHGLFGMMSLVILILMMRRAVKSAEGPWHRAHVAASMTWILGFMCVSGIRLVAPAFMFGMGLAKKLPESQQQENFAC